MKRYQKGDKAKPGFYLDARHVDFIQVDGGSKVIPESAPGSYVKIHGVPAAIIMGLLGLGMVLFLPFAAIVGLAAYLGKPFRRRKAPEVPGPAGKQS